jgi:hypothetical protein
MSRLLLPKPISHRVLRLLHLRAQIPLRSPSTRDYGQVFRESSSTITKLIAGVVQVFLDYEDLQM